MVRTTAPERADTADKKRKEPHHHHEVFSAEKAGQLDTRLRRLLYRPDILAERLVKPGDHVLDFGCGPGFFTREFAKRAGDDGKVIAVDLQEGMLRIVREKMEREGLLHRVMIHQCAPDSIGLPPALDGTVDVACAIFVVHEVPDPTRLFWEISRLLKPGGMFFYTEPFYVVPGKEFRQHLKEAENAGFEVVKRHLFFLNRAAHLRKAV
ncbi:MAG: class I SAM-dependent methyltransferase [Methanolinea sp.]|nr:class I SAM-dependent methyltransferase [Methanolinea sp.]